MLLMIFANTPLWVWALLAALIALGLRQALPRRVAPAQLLALPLAMLGLGLWSMAPAFLAAPSVALVWLAALALASTMGRRLRLPAAARWLPADRRLHLPGSWLPLLLVAVIFSLRYLTSVALVLHPEWRTDPQVQWPLALTFGTLSGLFLGRAFGLLQLTLPGQATIRRHDGTRLL